MSETLHPYQTDVAISGLAGLIPASILAFHLGWPLNWFGVMMTLSVFLTTFGFTRWIAPRLNRWFTLCAGLTFGAGVVHLSLWLPLLLASYVGGQGIERLDYAIPAAVFTALAVGWYVATAYLPVTALICLMLFGLVQVSRRKRRSL